MTSHMSYLRSTRHPWPSLLFVLPLLIAYEAGVAVLGGPHPEHLRNGADNWMRVGLMHVGISWIWLPPVVLSALMVVWAWKRRHDRPNEVLAVLSGMILESVALAIGLWGVSRALGPLLEHLGVELSVASASPAVGQVITYLGAGIYEEALFRLVLFSCLLRVLHWMDLNGVFAVVLAASASALLFSAAHHVGPYGQPYSNYLFLFRLIAGLYFALLFQMRGFGIAVGAHACYNLMVSIGAS